MNNPIYTAHRGLTISSAEIENSLGAIIEAIDNPEVGAIEIDIQETKDKHFVLMNYKTLDGSATNLEEGKNKVEDYTLDEIRKLHMTAFMPDIMKIIEDRGALYGEHAQEVFNWCLQVAAKQTKITELKDVLALDRKGKHLFIEIKTDYNEEDKEEIDRYVKNLLEVTKNASNYSFIGRDINTLLALKKQKPDVPISVVIGRTGIENATKGVDGISCAFDALEKIVPGTNQNLAQYIVSNNMPVAVWNILLQEEYDHTKEYLGDYPDVYLAGNYPELIKSYDKQRTL